MGWERGVGGRVQRMMMWGGVVAKYLSQMRSYPRDASAQEKIASSHAETEVANQTCHLTQSVDQGHGARQS